MEYRRAGVDDARTIAAMNWQLIRDEGHRNPMTPAELAARMAGWLGGEYEAYLFEEAGAPIGYALYRRDPEHVYLRQFSIKSALRRHGVGRAAIA
ncbi:MAG TPA: GNAT family N-acetyltransferase [Gemmataceae bacterium]|nr:GNAT family N-acetyltransferase [Gemmataceae bacterium]